MRLLANYLIEVSITYTYSNLLINKIGVASGCTEPSRKVLLYQKHEFIERNYYFRRRFDVRRHVYHHASDLIEIDDNHECYTGNYKLKVHTKSGSVHYIYPLDYYRHLQNEIQKIVKEIEDRLVVNSRLIELFRKSKDYRRMIKKINTELNEFSSFEYLIHSHAYSHAVSFLKQQYDINELAVAIRRYRNHEEILYIENEFI